jgi:hypothetical protein
MSAPINPVPFLKNVGFSGNLLVIATAIAGAESSFIPDRYNPEASYFAARGIPLATAQNEGSRGLFQIFQWEHPMFAGWDLDDPQINCCAMSIIWFEAGKSFNPWSTYRIAPPAYEAHLTQAQAYVAAASSTA